MTSVSTLDEANKLIEKAQRHKESEIQVPGMPFFPSVVIGCKCDVPKDLIKVNAKQGLEFAEDVLFPNSKPLKGKEYPYFFETSGKGKKKRNFVFRLTFGKKISM